MEKNQQTKSKFLEKVSNIYKSLTRLTKINEYIHE